MAEGKGLIEVSVTKHFLIYPIGKPLPPIPPPPVGQHADRPTTPPLQHDGLRLSLRGRIDRRPYPIPLLLFLDSPRQHPHARAIANRSAEVAPFVLSHQSGRSRAQSLQQRPGHRRRPAPHGHVRLASMLINWDAMMLVIIITCVRIYYLLWLHHNTSGTMDTDIVTL